MTEEGKSYIETIQPIPLDSEVESYLHTKEYVNQAECIAKLHGIPKELLHEPITPKTYPAPTKEEVKKVESQYGESRIIKLLNILRAYQIASK